MAIVSVLFAMMRGTTLLVRIFRSLSGFFVGVMFVVIANILADGRVISILNILALLAIMLSFIVLIRGRKNREKENGENYVQEILNHHIYMIMKI